MFIVAVGQYTNNQRKSLEGFPKIYSSFLGERIVHHWANFNTCIIDPEISTWNSSNL